MPGKDREYIYPTGGPDANKASEQSSVNNRADGLKDVTERDAWRDHAEREYEEQRNQPAQTRWQGRYRAGAKEIVICHMAKRSAGILAYRIQQQQLQVLLVHPGGPFYARKDAGVWSIPKGEYDEPEDALTVAKREFEEETGNKITGEKFVPLTPVKLKSGKIISAWAVLSDFERCYISSNSFEIEWPSKSGKMQSFPEVDKAEWFLLKDAEQKIHPAQVPLLKELEEHLSS